MNYAREQWRKLYVREPMDQRMWSLFTRALRDHLLRHCDDDGVIFQRSQDPAADICRALGALDTERDMVRDSVCTMLEDGYLEHGTDAGLRIRNFVDAQTCRSRDAARKAAYRQKKKSNGGGTTDGTAGGTTDGTAGGTKTGLSPQIRSDQIREIREREIIHKSARETPAPPHSTPYDTAKTAWADEWLAAKGAKYPFAGPMSPKEDRTLAWLGQQAYEARPSDPDGICREWLQAYFATPGSKGDHPLNAEWLKNVIASATAVSAETATKDRIWERQQREQEAANQEFEERCGKVNAK